MHRFNFETLKTLGQGSYGVVDLVKDDKGMLFALKTIQLNPFSREQSLEEVETLKLLSHPNLIKIYDFREREESLQILMEYCQGCTLKSYCNQNRGKISEQQIINLVYQIVDAALQMNEKGVIHRDLKPENILVLFSEQSPIIKICDFGCAKRSSIADCSISFQTSFEKGTALYTSPQQLNNYRYSSKCDVWALGCLLYELEFGTHPFKSPTIEGLKHSIRQKTDCSSLNITKDIDPLLKTILKITLQYQQRQRASWKQLKMIKYFRDQNDGSASFIDYLNDIAVLGQWIFQQVWEGRKQLQFNKQIKKGFVFFISGFITSIYKLIKEIVEKNQECQYLFVTDSVPNEASLIRAIATKSQEYQDIYTKIKEHIGNHQTLKKCLKKIPSKRNAAFANLQYTIKYAKKIVSEVIASKNFKQMTNYGNIIMILTKLVNFQKWFKRGEHIKLADVNQKKLNAQQNTAEWIKAQMGQ